MTISRRGLLGLGAAAAGALLTAREGQAQAPPANGPVAIASGNGEGSVDRAYKMMSEGKDPLDAGVAGVEIQELDPEDTSVGLGGLPNADGVVQLDASCMHGPSRRAGAVGALEGIATAAAVAQAVLERTDHIMLVGEGAKRFALELGFKETELLTERSRKAWLRWRANLNPNDNWIDYPEDAPSTTGTINLCARDANGDLASVTTTSGLSWKIPGRVGDSPIIGAGQYCDNEVGAAGSTGRGEANIQVCGAFLTVESMRQGLAPQDACLKTLERVVAATESRLLDDAGRPLFGLSFYALAKDGRFGAATLYPSRKGREPAGFAVADHRGARLEPMATLYDQRPKSWGA